MAIFVEIPEPIEREVVTATLTWSADHELLSTDLDDLEPGAPRYLIAFFGRAAGDPTLKVSTSISSGIRQQDPNAMQHSFTVVAVFADEVVARDRKLVRNGSSESA